MTTPLLHAGRRKRALPSSSPLRLSRNPSAVAPSSALPGVLSLSLFEREATINGASGGRRSSPPRQSATGELRKRCRATVGPPFREVTGRKGQAIPWPFNFIEKQRHLFHPGGKKEDRGSWRSRARTRGKEDGRSFWMARNSAVGNAAAPVSSLRRKSLGLLTDCCGSAKGSRIVLVDQDDRSAAVGEDKRARPLHRSAATVPCREALPLSAALSVRGSLQ